MMVCCTTSCSQLELENLANETLSSLLSPSALSGQTTPTSAVKPAKIRLSKSGETISMRWSGDTPTAIIEGTSTKGSQQGNGVYNFNPFGSKHYDLDVDFRKKTYILNQFDGAQLPTERGTIITL